MEVSVRGISIVVDVEATKLTYEKLALSESDQCSCAYCRNFRALGEKAFPPDVLDFFKVAGIPIEQFAEVYEFNETHFSHHLYGGEYYFFGKVVTSKDAVFTMSDGFQFNITLPSPLVPEQFNQVNALCFEFKVELPWVITDAP